MKENRKKAAEFLKEYRRLTENEKLIKEQIFLKEQLLQSIRISNPSTAPNVGGSSRYEDFLVRVISQKEELRLRLLIVSGRADTIRRIVDTLKGKERTVIERFYFRRSPRAADDLMEVLSLEKSQIYRIKDAALDKIYAAMTACGGEETLSE